MSQSKTIKKKVPYRHKIAFGMGMLANQMFPATLGIFMVVLVQNLGFPGWMWGIVYFLPRVLDAVTDPIVGFISDNTRSRFGRRRQYVISGAVIMGVAFTIMWQLYAENTVNYNFGYFLFWSFAFYIGLTIFSVPYVAMGYEMSDDFHERTEIMAIAQWIGQWAWVIAPWFWVIMYDPAWFPSAEAATRELAIYVGIIFALCAMIPGLFIPSKSTVNEDYESLTLNNIKRSLKQIIRGFKEALSLTPFRKLCISTFFIFNAFNTVAGFSFFIIVWYLFGGDAGEAGIWTPLFGSAGALVTTFLVIPIVARMSRKLGKKNAFMIAQTIALFGYASLWFLFVPGKPWMFLLALPFHSFGIGSLFVLMMSMTADVIDIDELNYGKRREGIFGAIYWYMVKFGFAIAGGLSGVILTVVGFDGNLSVQPEGAITGLRLFFSALPMFGTLVALWVMRDYDVTEEKANEVREILDARKAEKDAVAVPYSYQKDRLLSITSVDSEVEAIAAEIDQLSIKKLRKSFKESLNSGIHGFCFSPYLEGQNLGDQLSREQIEKRMKIVAPHTKWVRSFSCTDGNELIPEIAKGMGLKTLVGAWIDDNLEANKTEIENLIKVAKAGHADIVAIGNECLLRGELSEDQIIAYINQVKEALPGVPVSYVDTYYQLHQSPEVIEACDVVLANCYPFWEGYDAENSSVYLAKMYEVIKEVSDNKKVIIAETGWPTYGKNVDQAEPSIENMMKYFIRLKKWSEMEEVEVFYFSSFDESWKARHEGDVGARWGLWNKNEQLKVN
ncbi:MFS transporter [Rhodohalobacter barkolensis]|uniref:Endo-1,3-beta-glucanase btgC n=1 Tax=Rhodohalobacter barkolensis TaxID=2053187 RepID=A0A2N0VJ49_9BACT|nr:MFS transporter [Rhodohalobacter barkolensis]PKD44213.1 glycosyl hydrolase [Rhodohalobacter barkolensis]